MQHIIFLLRKENEIEKKRKSAKMGSMGQYEKKSAKVSAKIDVV